MAAKTKYGKYFHNKGLFLDIDHYDGTSLVAGKKDLGVDCSIGYHCLVKPQAKAFNEAVHTHDFDELLAFIGGNPLDIKDFGAEIEFTMDGEKHLITSTTVVTIPAGMKHCPLVFKKVTKPIVFWAVMLAPKYTLKNV